MKRIAKYYKYVMAGLGTLMTICIFGFANATNGLYLEYVTKDTGFSHTAFSWVFSIRFIVTAIFFALFETVYQKLKLRRTVVIGAMLLSAAYLAFSFSRTIVVFYLMAVLWGVAIAFTTNTVFVKITDLWFAEHKGLVLGIMFGGSGIGGFIANLLVSDWITRYGWMTAYRLSGIIFFVLGIILLLFFKNGPQDVGLPPLETPEARQGGKDEVSQTLPLARRLVRRPFFYMVTALAFLVGFLTNPIYTAATTHLIDRGISPGFVAGMLSVMFFILALTKTVIGYMYDRLGLKRVVLMCLGADVLAILLLSRAATTAHVIAYTALIAIAIPLETVMMPMIVKDLMGGRVYRLMYGFFMAVCTAGSAIGNPVINAAYDRDGTYVPVLGVLTLLALGAAALFWVCTRLSGRFKDGECPED